MGGQINRIVEKSAPRCARCRHRSLAGARDSAATGANINFRLVHGVSQRMRVVGVVGKKLHVHIEGDEKGFIFRAQNAAEKCRAGLLLQRQNILLAPAGVEQDAQGQRLIVLGGEVLDLLRRLVFEDSEVILGEMGNQRAVLVVHGEVKAYQVDIDLEGRHRLLLIVLIRVSGRPLRRGVRGRRDLGHRGYGGDAQQDCPEQTREAKIHGG